MKHTTFNKLFVLVVLTFALVVISGCSGSSVTVMEGAQRDAVLAKAEPITTNLFDGLVKADFATFTRDFDPTMKKVVTQARFDEILNTLNSKVGKYQSCEVANVQNTGQHYAVNYKCKFEQEDGVSWRVVLTTTDPAQVSGLWYDSPKLRVK